VPHAPAIPAPANENGFDELPAWAPPAFDEPDRSDKPRYIRELPPIGAGGAPALEELRRNQYRSLRSVDRAVGELLAALDETGRLDDALVIFTSDNGILWGEHRWTKKEVPYEEAIRVPLVVRADGIAGEVPRPDGHLVANIDLAPTVSEMAGVELPGADGKSLIPLIEGDPVGWRGALLIEHVQATNPVPTYCAVRTKRHLFVAYATGERELYDLDTDPGQLDNLAGAAPALEERLAAAHLEPCEPLPAGQRPQMGAAATFLAMLAVLGIAVVARAALAGHHRAPG
jgi:N-acetylglucosamine-6-sulfatase